MTTLARQERTNNVCEGWNNAFAHFIGHTHPSVWTLLRTLQQDEVLVSTDLLQDARGQLFDPQKDKSVIPSGRDSANRIDSQRSLPTTLIKLFTYNCFGRPSRRKWGPASAGGKDWRELGVSVTLLSARQGSASTLT